MAHWLDTVCRPFDYAVLEAIHRFALWTGGENSIFTWFMRFVSFLGEEGIGLILLGLLLFCFRKTRKAGLCVLASLLCGALITNVILKNAVGRIRPFRNEEVAAFRQWWEAIGATHAGQRSFPSGHTTSAVAAMTALFLTLPKKYSWTAFLFALLTALSRMYLMVHYPTDVLAGMLAGALGALGGYFLARWLLSLPEGHKNAKWANALLTFDIGASLHRRLCARKGACSEKSPETVPENGGEKDSDASLDSPPKGE